MNKNKVLITGVAGFIGSNLAERLLKEGGYEIIGIDNLAYGREEQIPKGVEFHKADIRLPDIYPLFSGVDYVFHLAAKNCIADCQQDPVETAAINITGTVNVFEAAKRAKVHKIIYAESSALYEGIGQLPTPETSVAPETFYAVSKLAGSEFAKAYQKFYGLNTVGLRYFNVYGPRQDYRRIIPPVMSAFIIKLLRGEQPVIYGNGSKRRDFIHVDDINDFHNLCLRDSRVDGKVFNIGSGKNYSVLEIYQLICGLLDVKIQPSFEAAKQGEAQESLADISAARALGWGPKVDLQIGLKGMVGYIKDEMEKGNVK